MGDGGIVVCENCKEQFNVMNGVGMSSYALTCEECGIQKVFPIIEDGTESNFTCSCGGRFTQDANVKCPKCQSTDYEYISFMHWD